MGALLSAFSPASAQVVISEIHYDPIGGSTNEFVELFNAGTNEVQLGNWRFTDGITYLFPSPTPLPTGAYLVVAADRAAFALRYPGVTNLAPGAFSGQLSNQGERLGLADAATAEVFAVTYNNAAPWPVAAAGLGSSLVLLDPHASPTNPANWGASAEVHGSPGGPGGQFVQDIVINEVLPHTDPPQEDAVELANLTTNAVDVTGWFLSDDSAERRKYRFPTNSIVPPLGYLVVYQVQMTNGTDALIPFSISSKGDDLFLSQGNTTGDLVRFVDEIQFEPSKNGVAFGRYPDGTGDIIPVATPTFGAINPTTLEEFRAGTGARNAGPWVGPVVINEIMYHPSTSSVPARMPAEYIELLNASADPVPLFNVDYPELAWSLTGGIDFTFPTNLTLAPGQFLVVVNTNDLDGFRASYGISTNVLILGPWSNGLNNAGDTLRLRVPNSPEPPSNIAARYVADEVTFNDKLPWPLAADGLGGALERTDPAAYGNTAENWHSFPGLATPGRTNSVDVPPGSIVISEIMAVNRHTLRDEDGEFSDWIELYNTRPYGISLAGWHLTDQATVPALWTFPAVTIPAHGYLVVFASQKNRTNDLAHLHTNFALDEAGEYLALFRSDLVRECAFDPAYPPQSADVGYGYEQFGNMSFNAVEAGTTGRYLVPTNAAALATNWTARSFDESGWLPATNGLGYDTETTYTALIATDLRTQMQNRAGSFFVRFPFAITNSAGVGQVDLNLKFEDGFIAWLNGAPVASNNVPASAAWNSLAPANRLDTLAVVFTNYSLSAYAHLLVEGTNVIAFQGLNTTLGSSDLLLLPELKLTWIGGSTGLTGQAMGYLYPGTPGGINGSSLPGVVPAPTLSHPGGVFGGGLSVTVLCARADAELRYTLDGSDPTTNSPLYTAPLSISNDTELLVRAFRPGLVASPAVGAVYRLAFLGINEVLASNATTSPEIRDFTDYGDFIELFNAGTNAISLGGYHLSDNLEQPFRWPIPAGAVIPARGHLLVWADGFDSRPGLTLTRTYWNYWSFTTVYYHSNFKLGAEGESVGLFSPSGSRIDAVTFGPQSVDISYGRFPDGAADWGYFGEPTAGTTNRAPTLTHNLYRAPKVTIAPTNDALMVTGEVQVALGSDPGVSEIRYTTNGAIPTSSSLLYTQSFTLVTSGVIRARAYAPDRHPGPVATRTFLRRTPASDLPLISLVIDPRLLFDPAIGIYTNLFKEREVPGNLQFCTTPSNTGFQIDAGFRLYGLNTFLYPQKPFTVYLDSKYGQDLLPYQLFPDKPLGTFDRFILRNGNDDWRTTFFRDTLGQKMLKGVIDNATQGYRPCSIFLNGDYYGLVNIQEKMDEMYCTRNYGVATTNIDFFENDGFTAAELLDAGTADGWTALLAFLSTNSLADPTHYAYVKSQVDVEDLVDYVAAQTFVVETSWTHNRKWWRDRNPGGRWRWCFVDLDRALNSANVNYAMLSEMASGMVVFRECLASPEFRAFCAQRMMAHLNSSFSTNRILPIIDAEALSIRAELVQHIAKYSAVTGIPSIATWDTRVESIRSFCRQRPAAASQQVLTYFATGQAARVQVDLTGGGRVLANHVALIPGVTNTFAGGLPLRFTAQPDIGQAFVRWEVSSNGVVFLVSTNGPDLDWTPRNGESVQAILAPAGVSLLPSVIATNTALTAAESPYYATGDIFVPSNTTLAAGPGVEILLPDTADIRVQGRLQLLGTTGEPVRVMPNTNANARMRYYVDPARTDTMDLLPRWGGISFEHATHTGELVNVLLRGASLTKTDPVNHKAAISALGSDLWMDGVDLDEVQFPIFVQEGRSTVLQNSRVHLAITGDGINIKRAAYARVENCEMTGALEIDADAIDYDGVQGGIIRGNRLHDFLGDNDDAIDIGEGALDLLVESNLIYRMSDKGVSIGQASTAIVRHNLIRDCALGVGIKDAGSYGLIEYNTFHKTGNAIALYEKNLGVGGGAGDIRGSIFSETTLEPVTVDAFSTAQVSYCLSDTLPVAGPGNLTAQPQFLNAANMNFHLQAGSAAVDAGPPGDPADADGSRRDIGARPFDWRAGHVMVSEIHYHPADASQSEFVELHNPGGAALDLTGFRFAKGVVFDFPPGTTLAPGQYLVIASGTNGLAGVTNLLVWTTGVLDNAGEIIELRDADSNELDRVAYASFDPWPAQPDGAGPSLSVINPRRDNSLPENWYASGGANGTPGAPFDHQLAGPLAFGRMAGGGQSLGFAALPGLRYVLEFTEDLIIPDWQPVDSGYRGLDGRVLFQNAPAVPPPAGSYRIRVESP